MGIKEQDLIKFWTWCGFTLRCPKEKDAYGRGLWNYPNGTYGDLELNPDTIYKYAIPKLQNKGYSITLTAFECSGFSANIFDSRALSEESFLKEPTEVRADNPTEALFNAIMKVINQEEK